MLTKEKIVIKDACILFDLLDLSLMKAFYRLRLTVLTTPQVISEIIDENQLNEVMLFIENGNLIIDGSGTLDSIQLISNENRGLSLTDSSVLELAIRINCTILSSDGALRKVSSRQGLEVRGMLWVIEKLCNEKVISIEDALVKLKNYPKINQRVPKKEIEDLIKKLTQI